MPDGRVLSMVIVEYVLQCLDLDRLERLSSPRHFNKRWCIGWAYRSNHDLCRVEGTLMAEGSPVWQRRFFAALRMTPPTATRINRRRLHRVQPSPPNLDRYHRVLGPHAT